MGINHFSIGILSPPQCRPLIPEKMVSSPAPSLKRERLINRIRIWQSTYPELTQYLQPIRLIHFPLMAAFVCAIISGVWTNPTSNNIDKGYQLRRAADIIFLICVLCIAGLAFLLYSKSRTREQRMDLVLLQVLFVTPFLLIRIIYAVVQAFLSTPTKPGRNIWVYLGLLLIPDFISVSIYTICGFKVKQMPPAAEWQDYNTGKNNETIPQSGQPGPTDAEGNVQAAQPPRRRQRRRGRRGPIGMLIGAILDARG